MAYFNFFYKVNSSQFPNHCDRFFKGLWALICSIKYWFHFFLERNQSPVQIQNWFALPGHYPYKHFNQFCPFHQPYPELIFGGTNHCPGYWKAENLFHELISMQLIFSIEWELNWFVSMFRCVLYWSCWVNPFYEINSISSFGWAQAI